MHPHLPGLFGITFALLSASALAQQATGSTSLLVIEPQRQYAHGTFPRHASWQGLHCQALDCELQATPVTVTTSTANNVLEEIEPLDVLAVTGAPVVSFPQALFPAGKIPTWYRISHPVDPPQVQNLLKLGKWQMPWGDRPLTLSWVVTPEGAKRYHVSDGATKQFLFSTSTEGHYSGDTTPVVHWVGDLDGDGKLDLLLDLPDDNCGFDERLYLSSDAGEGKLLRKAAQSTGREAACGC
jgi:hypothetical protein